MFKINSADKTLSKTSKTNIIITSTKVDPIFTITLRILVIGECQLILNHTHTAVEFNQLYQDSYTYHNSITKHKICTKIKQTKITMLFKLNQDIEVLTTRSSKLHLNFKIVNKYLLKAAYPKAY